MKQAIKTKRIKYGTGAYVTARLTTPEKQALDAIATEERRTLSQVARFAIQEFLSRRAKAGTHEG
jgi:predicted transcriptional regulator